MNREEILERAKKCVNGGRDLTYGSPESNFDLIARLWGVYKGVEFTPVDVSLMMGLMKVARASSGSGSLDTFVDLAGYAACGGELWAKENGYANKECTCVQHTRCDSCN